MFKMISCVCGRQMTSKSLHVTFLGSSLTHLIQNIHPSPSQSNDFTKTRHSSRKQIQIYFCDYLTNKNSVYCISYQKFLISRWVKNAPQKACLLRESRLINGVKQNLSFLDQDGLPGKIKKKCCCGSTVASMGI